MPLTHGHAFVLSYSEGKAGTNGNPWVDLTNGKITGEEYARRVRAQIRARLRETPPPRRA